MTQKITSSAGTSSSTAETAAQGRGMNIATPRSVYSRRKRLRRRATSPQVLPDAELAADQGELVAVPVRLRVLGEHGGGVVLGVVDRVVA
jgi:hypothetical protein